jgi:hypothetical protein
MISSEKVCQIVVKARAWDAKVPAVTPESGSNPIEDDMRETLEDDGEDLTERELRAFIAGLNEDEKAELIALYWVGRGSYAREEWKEAVAEAHRQSGSVADYLLGEPMLGDLLADGLAAFDIRCDD